MKAKAIEKARATTTVVSRWWRLYGVFGGWVFMIVIACFIAWARIVHATFEWSEVAGGVAVIVAAWQWVLKPMNRNRNHYRWAKQIDAAFIFTLTVQMYHEMDRRAKGFERLLQDRTNFLQGPPANCSLELVLKDDGIREMLEQMVVCVKGRDSRLSSLENGVDDLFLYNDEYLTEIIFLKWKREMSAEFREMWDGEIEGLRKIIKTPGDVLTRLIPGVDIGAGGYANPDNVEPNSPSFWVILTHPDGCVERFKEDVVDVYRTLIKIGTGDIQTVYECPTGEHYKGRKWVLKSGGKEGGSDDGGA